MILPVPSLFRLCTLLALLSVAVRAAEPSVETSVTQATKLEILRDGHVSGTVSVSKGAKLKVIALEGAQVQVSYRSIPGRVPAAHTELASLAAPISAVPVRPAAPPISPSAVASPAIVGAVTDSDPASLTASAPANVESFGQPAMQPINAQSEQHTAASVTADSSDQKAPTSPADVIGASIASLNNPANIDPGPVAHMDWAETNPQPAPSAVASHMLIAADQKPAATTAVTNGAPVANTNRPESTGLQALGISLTERGDWVAAEIAFRQILASPRSNADELASALIGLARVFRRQGALTKAAAIYERYLADYPSDDHVPDALLELGRTHRALGAHQMALARFYSVINSTLKLSTEGFTHYQMLAKTAQFEIAETHFQQGNFTEANKFFSRLRLLDLAPADRARAHFKSAYALYLGADHEGTVRTLHSYLEQWPEDENVPEARYLLSLSLRALGRKQEALDATLQLLRTQQAAGDAKRWTYWKRRTGNQLANDFFQGGETANALAIYQGLALLSTEPAWQLPVTYQIGLCYERMRLSDRASAAYQSIVDGTNCPAVESKASDKPGRAAVEPTRAASPELIDLARMAAWRLSQLNWHDQTERQLAGIFSTGAAPVAQPPPASASIAPTVEGPNPTRPSAPTSAHAHSGNTPPASPSL
jgi:TolA-binding protein